MMMDGAAMSDLDEDTAKSTSGSEEEEEFVMSGSKVVEEEEEEAPKEIVKVEEAAEAPRPVEGAETSSDVGIKRSVEEMEGGLKEAAPMPSPARPRLNINKSDKGQIGSHRNRDSKENRWRPHVVSEDYVNFVGDIMYPQNKLGSYGFDPNAGRYSVERFSSLGYILNPLRRPTTIEKWSPYEVAVFEGSMSLFGKDFWQASKLIKTKSTKDVIEFYYCWKKTDHYKQWKKQYTPDERDVLQRREE